MTLRLHEIVAPVQRIEPDIQKESAPITLFEDEASRTQIFLVLRNDKVHVSSLQVRKGLDDAVRGHDGNILEHHGLETLAVEDVRLEREFRVHDQGVGAEVEEVGGMRIRRQGMANGRHNGPTPRSIVQVRFILRYVGEEIGIAFLDNWSQRIRSQQRGTQNVPCRAA